MDGGEFNSSRVSMKRNVVGWWVKVGGQDTVIQWIALCMRFSDSLCRFNFPKQSIENTLFCLQFKTCPIC